MVSASRAVVLLERHSLAPAAAADLVGNEGRSLPSPLFHAKSSFGGPFPARPRLPSHRLRTASLSGFALPLDSNAAARLM